MGQKFNKKTKRIEETTAKISNGVEIKIPNGVEMKIPNKFEVIGHSAVVWKGNIIVFGGRERSGSYTNKVAVYNVA